MISFDVEVKTADKLWAGTDDTVKISFSGPISGATKTFWTGKVILDGKGVNDHERGLSYVYHVTDCPPPLDQIDKLTVLKNGSDDWNLEYIKGMVSFL